MSRPKNTTSNTPGQGPVTAKLEPGTENCDASEILEVRAGVCVVDALEISSCRLSEALLFIKDYSDFDVGLKTSGVYLLQECLISAKAVLDSSIKGLMSARHAGGLK